MIVPYFIPKFYYIIHILVSSSNDDNEDANPPLSAYFQLVGSVEHEPTPVPRLPIWVYRIEEVIGDINSDYLYLYRICSKF
jgi:hypothetical protein